MRKFWLASSVVIMFVLAGLIILSGPSKAQVNSQQTLPLDRTATFKTHVPHANIHFQSSKPSSKPSGGGGKPGGSSGSGSSIFTGADFNSVGATVNATSSIPEAEEHIAVDPTNGKNLVAMISDFSLRGGYNTSKYSVSYDNGGSWAQAFVPLGAGQRPATSDGQTWDANSDPVVAIDNSGRVYLANLYFNATNGNNAGGLYVSVGSLGITNLDISQAKTYPVATNLNPNTTTSEDKEWIAVDNSGSQYKGRVYVSWTRFVGNTDFILVSYSTDYGVNWSTPIQISPTSQNGAVQGSQIAVGPNGEVYVVYEVFFVGNNRAQYMAKSTNGGASFSSPVAITPQFGELSFNSSYRKNSFASLAVSPTSNGNVYVVYPDQPKHSSSRIEFTSSTDGGGSFSSPVTINDSTAGQRLMPSVAVDGSGNVSVSWFDTRNGSSTAYYDIYATRTTDAGTTFSPNAPVTQNTIYASNASFIGDYGGIAAGSGDAHPVWTNGGFYYGLLQTAALGY